MSNLGAVVLVLIAVGVLLTGIGLLPTTPVFWAVIAVFAAALGVPLLWRRR